MVEIGEETEETGEVEVVVAAPEQDEAAAKVEVAVRVEARNTAPSPRLKPLKCVTVITSTETRLGTVWLQQPVHGSTRSSPEIIENSTSLEEIKKKTFITTRYFQA